MCGKVKTDQLPLYLPKSIFQISRIPAERPPIDFITHTLIGTGAARVICPRREWLPQICLAGALGSLLMDGDSWVQFIDINAYGRYHRVVTHSLPGLVATALLAAAIAIWIARVPSWRQFGFFVSPNIFSGDSSSLGPTSRAPLAPFFFATAAAGVLHFCGDAVTGFGNMILFWPVSDWDASLSATISFDYFIFSVTLAWHITLRNLGWNRRREALILVGYLAVMAVYIAARFHLTEPTVW